MSKKKLYAHQQRKQIVISWALVKQSQRIRNEICLNTHNHLMIVVASVSHSERLQIISDSRCDATHRCCILDSKGIILSCNYVHLTTYFFWLFSKLFLHFKSIASSPHPLTPPRGGIYRICFSKTIYLYQLTFLI